MYICAVKKIKIKKIKILKIKFQENVGNVMAFFYINK